MIGLLPTQHLDAMRSWEGIWGILGNLPVIGRYLNRLITRVMIQVIRRTGKKFAWPNTWAGREVVPELLGRLSAEGVSDQVLNYLEHPEQLAAMRQQLRLLRGPAGAAERLARLILDTLDFPQNASRPTQPSPDPTHDSTPALP
jgi:lipid-A-disaccharide synthase